jgi:hypothetical protein
MLTPGQRVKLLEKLAIAMSAPYTGLPWQPGTRPTEQPTAPQDYAGSPGWQQVQQQLASAAQARAQSQVQAPVLAPVPPQAARAPARVVAAPQAAATVPAAAAPAPARAPVAAVPASPVAAAPAPVAAAPAQAVAPAKVPAVAPAAPVAPVAPAAPAGPKPLVMRANQGYGWLAQQLSKSDPNHNWSTSNVRTAMGNRMLRAGETIDTSKLFTEKGSNTVAPVASLAKATYADTAAKSREEGNLRRMMVARRAAQTPQAAPQAPVVPVAAAPAAAPVPQPAAPTPAPKPVTTSLLGRNTYVAPTPEQMALGPHDVSRSNFNGPAWPTVLRERKAQAAAAARPVPAQAAGVKAP